MGFHWSFFHCEPSGCWVLSPPNVRPQSLVLVPLPIKLPLKEVPNVVRGHLLSLIVLKKWLKAISRGNWHCSCTAADGGMLLVMLALWGVVYWEFSFSVCVPSPLDD